MHTWLWKRLNTLISKIKYLKNVKFFQKICHVLSSIKMITHSNPEKFISNIIPITNCTYCRTMANRNNVELAFQSTESAWRVARNDSVRSIVSSENTRPECSAQRIFISAMDAINHVLIIAVTVYLVYYSAKEHHVTNIHVILCTFGVSIPSTSAWNTRLILLLLRRLFSKAS